MKTLVLSLLLGSFLLLLTGTAYAQTNDNTRRSDQAMNDLLNEVRLLREDIRRLATSAYRAAALTERVKLQQDQVNRMNNDLIGVRADISAARSTRSQLKEKIAVTQQRVESGSASPNDLNSLKAMLADLDQREPELTLKESQLSTQLNNERANLEELYKKLDAIDVELQSQSNDEKTPKQKPQE